MTVQIVAENLSNILSNFPEINLVYLFGSRVTGQIGPMSDYDVAIQVEVRNDEDAIRAHFQHAIIQMLNTERVDIVLLDRAPVELAYHIISTGKPLYQRDLLTRVEFEARILGQYGDYLPVLRAQRNQILQGDTHAKRVQRYREAFGRTQRSLGEARTSQE